MTPAIEDLLTASMREEVAGLTPAPDLVARAVRRHRQRTRIRRAASVAGTAGIAAAVAIGLTVTSSGPGAAPARPGAARTGGKAPGPRPGAAQAADPAARSPRARLVAAMVSSAQLSYRLHLVNTARTPGHQMTPTSRPRDLIYWYADYTGVYDPRTHSGTGINILRFESGTLADPSTYGKVAGYVQLRIIGDRYYTRSSSNPEFRGSSPWSASTGSLVRALDLNGDRGWAPTSGASADPAVLLATVRRLGHVRLAGRSGRSAAALDTYKFGYKIAGDGSVRRHLLTGTIVVHHQSNLIARITMRTSVTGAHPQIADSGQLTFRTVMTFSDYGVAVSVRAPAITDAPG